MSGITRLLALALLPPLAGAVVSANPARRAPHQNWREARLHDQAPEFERWFIPGPLGHEPGASGPYLGPRAYLTRSFAGADRPEERAWQEHNDLGPGIAFSHNLSNIFPPALFDTHPEYFPELGGKRWRPPAHGPVLWNPDLGEPAVARHAAQVARDFFSAKPDAITFALGINDAMRFGDSPATARWTTPTRYFRDRPDYSDLVFNFMNRVAADLEADWPNKHLGALAYYWTEQTPTFPVHPKVLPFLTADRSQGYDRDFRGEERALQHRWVAAGPERLGIYDYLYGYGFLVPRLHTALLARHLREARDAGFTDYYAEVYPHWGLAGPQPWLVAQLLRDPDQSAKRLLEEYHRRHFRTAAAPMRRFHALCERQWMSQEGPAYWLKHYRSDSQASLYPAPVRRQLRALLDEAARRAEPDPVAAARVKLVSAAFSVSERYVEMVEARQALALAVLARRTGASELALTEKRKRDRDARAAFLTTLESVRRDQPLAFGPVHLDDVLRDDWGPAADDLIAGKDPRAGRELLPDPAWSGPLTAELRQGDLLLEPALTAGWRTRSEPWKNLRAELLPSAISDSGRVLRLEHNKHSQFETWTRIPEGGETSLVIDVRGHAGPLTRLFLRASWLTEDFRRTGRPQAIALPAGDWPEGTLLHLPLRERPANAAAVHFILTVFDQQAEDWLELSAPSVRWSP